MWVCVCARARACVCVCTCAWWWAVVKRASRQSLCTSATARPKASSQLAHKTPSTTAHVLVSVVLVSHIAHAESLATQPSPLPHTMHTLLVACTHAHVPRILHSAHNCIPDIASQAPHSALATQHAISHCGLRQAVATPRSHQYSRMAEWAIDP